MSYGYQPVPICGMDYIMLWLWLLTSYIPATKWNNPPTSLGKTHASADWTSALMPAEIVTVDWTSAPLGFLRLIHW